MYLLNVHTRRLESFYSEAVPKYAILSHTWGSDEIIFSDMQSDLSSLSYRGGYAKIEYSCHQAAADGLAYVWIDTCCIDKSSSAELSESINSMFRYYRDSELCYVFLSDFSYPYPNVSLAMQDNRDHILSPQKSSEFKKCRWFTRGWTLQELLAPREVLFYSQEWVCVGTRSTLLTDVSSVTNIPYQILDGRKELHEASVAQRMSWASSRQTTRTEDMAYSLLGIFGVNMPLLYGEGTKAFLRLQEEVLRETEDLSIFAWTAKTEGDNASMFHGHGLFADSPLNFAKSQRLVSFKDWTNVAVSYVSASRVSVRLPVRRLQGDKFDAMLSCGDYPDFDDQGKAYRCTIRLMRIPGQGSWYARIPEPQLAWTDDEGAFHYEKISVSQQPLAPTFGDINIADSFMLDNTKYSDEHFDFLYSIYKEPGPSESKIYRSQFMHIAQFPLKIPDQSRRLCALLAFCDKKTQSTLFLLIGSGSRPGTMIFRVAEDPRFARMTQDGDLESERWLHGFHDLERFLRRDHDRGPLRDRLSESAYVVSDCTFDPKSGGLWVELHLKRGR